MNHLSIKNLGQLKASGYQPKKIKDELRENLIVSLQKKQNVFEGIQSYNETVIPDLQRAILSRHNILLLGLRGQAKTKLARLMVNLLDEYIPFVAGSELNDDPMQPLSRYALDLIAKEGDNTPVQWLHRSERYTEKLATPDVSIADLIGDADPIKAANLKLPYSDERVIHFGLIPRSHRCLFVINELPDLQARIQVSLFNILQEGDIQIRGFKIRLPLDIQFVFTANPEDYTNRGSIVTPLKDRIQSQILTHYPKQLKDAQSITQQESKLASDQEKKIFCSPLASVLLEQISFEARSSEYIDPKSGVSARLSISANENLHSTAELRMMNSGDERTWIRISDFQGILPSITGKIELVYEGEQEGGAIVAQNIIGKAIRNLFTTYFPNPEKQKKKKEANPFLEISDWFSAGNEIDLLNSSDNKTFTSVLKSVPGLEALVSKYHPTLKGEEKLLMMEFVLHALAEYSLLSKNKLELGVRFKDLFSSVFNTGSEN